MDAQSPSAPQPPYFDSGRQAWILSRYADVLAALREPGLQQERFSPTKATSPRAKAAAALAPASFTQWQSEFEARAHQMMGALPRHRPVELMHEVIRPCTLDLAISLVDGEARRERLRKISRRRSAPSARLNLPRAWAAARFKLFFRKRAGEKSAFVGVSETLPGFLANAWVALLRHPDQLVRLRDHPESIPAAIEELLRYAGLVHSLSRQAAVDVRLSDVSIAAGQRVVLKLASANRDPEQFPNPNCLDIDRRPSSHLALGHGDHSCVGALVLRQASAALTRPFVSTFASAKMDGDIEWRWGETLVWPAALMVMI